MQKIFWLVHEYVLYPWMDEPRQLAPGERQSRSSKGSVCVIDNLDVQIASWRPVSTSERQRYREISYQLPHLRSRRPAFKPTQEAGILVLWHVGISPTFIGSQRIGFRLSAQGYLPEWC